jgi:hypothetical protein
MPSETEARAIAKLIAQIDDLDAVRDQVGRRVIALFMVTFAAALTLLFYVALHDDPLTRLASPGSARVQPVLPGAPR